MGEPRSEYRLKSSPTDAISSIKFSPISSQYLITASWDATVRLYDIINNVVKHQYKHSQFPVLDCVLQNANTCFSGGMDKAVVSYDFTAQTPTILGYHDDTIRCVEFSADRTLVVTGSWDSTVRVWDPRIQGTSVGSFQAEEKVYTMSLKDELLVVGTAERKIIAWDVRNMTIPLQKRDSLLKYQTRCLRVFPNKQGYVLGSIEGRVSVEYLDPNPDVQKRKYAFKCHRTKEGGVECIYPVNAISFHEEESTFATGGSDGFVNIWDGFNKKRLCQFHRYPAGIASLAFSPSGNILAIACSYLFEQDEPPVPMPEDVIFIRNVTDQETKPK